MSVAQPAPAMKAYIAVRAGVEAEIRTASADSGIAATILRPWYVLGPGHLWPHALRPLYAIAGQIPALRDGARRMGLVTREQMVAALVRAVEHPPAGVAIIDVPAIRRSLPLEADQARVTAG